MHEVEIDASCLQKFYTIVFPSIITIATSGLIFEFFYFFPSIQTPSTKIFFQTLSIFFYIMSMISYYFAIHIKNNLPQTLITPRIKLTLKNNHNLYTQKKTCPKESQKFKPKRTSHCHSCGCVARMDHHCPYTNNCVGARSLKAFILFCLYGGLFALEFIVLSMTFYFKLSNGTIEKLSELGVTIWMILTIIAIFLAFSMISLSLTNLVMAGKNITQLQVMKGIFRFNDKHGSFPNPFDLGLFTNINTIFGGDYWLFWFPTEIKSDCDFTEFPMRPYVTQSQIKQLPNTLQIQLEDPYIRTIPKTIEQLRKKQQTNYQGVIFFYLGKPYQLIKQQLKQTLADIHNSSDQENQIKIQKQTQKTSNLNHTEQEKQILANIYDD